MAGEYQVDDVQWEWSDSTIGSLSSRIRQGLCNSACVFSLSTTMYTVSSRTELPISTPRHGRRIRMLSNVLGCHKPSRPAASNSPAPVCSNCYHQVLKLGLWTSDHVINTKSSVEVFVDLGLPLKHSFIQQNRICLRRKDMFEISIPLALLASQ